MQWVIRMRKRFFLAEKSRESTIFRHGHPERHAAVGRESLGRGLSPDMATQNVIQPWDEKALAALNAGQIDRAFDALVQGYQKRVLAYCIATMGDYAIGEEVALDVCEALW